MLPVTYINPSKLGFRLCTAPDLWVWKSAGYKGLCKPGLGSLINMNTRRLTISHYNKSWWLFTKAQYTLATKLNSTRSTLLKVDCCRNRQQIGNKVDCCCIRSTLLPICRQQCEFDILSRSTLLPIWWTLLPIRSTLLPIWWTLLPIRSTLLPIQSTLLPVCMGPK